MKSAKSKRRRGVTLNPSGLAKFEAVRRETEFKEKFGGRYTLEELSEYSGLDLHTIKKILRGKQGVDKRSLERLFMAFKLELEEQDYALPHSNRQQNWGEAVCVDTFFGRSRELKTLEQWILKEGCRLVTILGMGGVGKTSLSVKLAQQVQDRFDLVIWRSLRDAPPLPYLLDNIAQFMFDESNTESKFPQEANQQIPWLLEALREQRCLLVFDNVESLLQEGTRAGIYRQGCEVYGELFRRIGESNHQSCLLLTAREKPKEVAFLEGKSLPTRRFQLGGFQEGEAEKIFQLKGIEGSATDFNRLAERYSGNALALQIVATSILDLFAGKVENFLREETSVFGDIRDLLAQQFKRLSTLEQEIMYWLAINREPTSLSQLQEDLVSRAPKLKLLEALESLVRRSLLEKNEACFTLQPVIMEYVTGCLIETITEEIFTQKLSLFQSHALIQATAKDYIRETQVRLILQPVLGEALSRFGNASAVERRFTQILASARLDSVHASRSCPKSGYLAGNVIFTSGLETLSSADGTELIKGGMRFRPQLLRKAPPPSRGFTE